MLRATKADSPRRSKRQYLEGTRPELVKAAWQFWWPLQDLNLGPTDYESAALTAELRGRSTKYNARKGGSLADSPPPREPCQAMISGSPRSPFPEMATATFPSSRLARCSPQATLPDAPSQVRIGDGICTVYPGLRSVV